jgi:hypothetical protein
MASLLFGPAAAYAQDQTGDPNAQTPPPEGGTPAAAPAATVSGAPVANTKENYPGQFIQRPRILPQFMAQPEFALGVNNTSAATGESIAVGFDMGLMDKLQAGAAVFFPVNPNADFGSFLVNGQYNLMDQLNVRLDLGATKYGTGTGSATGFSFGLGLPLKWNFTDMIALVSGNTWAILNDNIFGGTIVSGAKVFYINVPVGVLVQPHEMIGIQARTGFHADILQPDVGNSTTAKSVPIAIDLMANIIKIVDVGFTFSLPGCIESGCGYSDVRVFNIWAGARL